MAKDTTNRRKKKKSAKARRIKRIILVIMIFVLLSIIAGVVGVELYKKWEARFDSTTSVVFILKDGKVVSNDVIAFDTSKYNQNELGVFIEETISTYNKENGDESVVKESLEIENNIASLILTYADADTYKDFSGTELYVGTISEAVAKGYTFAGQFASIVDGKAVPCSIDKFYGRSDLKVAIIKANTKIQVDGKIMYLSTENVAEFGENWIVTKDGCNLLANSKVEDSETGTGTTETEGLETETTDGSVDGTELVTEEEETSTEIIFDFGDEDVPTAEDDTYSEVYTYIIFR